MFNYVKESYNELVHKVTWPTFAQLQNSTVVVMVASLIFAIVILTMEEYRTTKEHLLISPIRLL
jgi:preprotein translocase subunit SecE